MIDPAVAQRFLAQRRVALVGASDDPKSFASTVQHDLESHGTEVVAVNPGRTTVGGAPCYPDIASVPGTIDGVMVMTPADRATDVVRDAIGAGVPRVWLFKGAGKGALSSEAVRLCEEHDVEVVAGACPLMFLEPVGFVHRFHRGMRRLNRSLAKSA